GGFPARLAKWFSSASVEIRYIKQPLHDVSGHMFHPDCKQGRELSARSRGTGCHIGSAGTRQARTRKRGRDPRRSVGSASPRLLQEPSSFPYRTSLSPYLMVPLSNKHESFLE